MSKNIVINIYGANKVDVDGIELKDNIKVLKSNQVKIEDKYNLEIDSSIISDLDNGSRVKLYPINKINLFEYNYFIYEGQQYIVEITKTTNQDIDFYHPQYGEDISIDINGIEKLCSVKVVREK